MSYQTIYPQELYSKHQSGEHVEIIDVRTPKEFQQVHATLARNVPLDSLDPHHVFQNRNGHHESPLFVICQSGTRANMACRKFAELGLNGVVLVEGGTAAWVAAGLPVERGRKVISVDRQMRIVAGTLTLLGVAGSLWQPYMIGLSAFIGAGLVFAGVTDYCPMMKTLARMPWNQGEVCPPCNAPKAEAN